MLYTTEEKRYGPGPPRITDMAINSPANLKSSLAKANTELTGHPFEKALIFSGLSFLQKEDIIYITFNSCKEYCIFSLTAILFTQTILTN